MIANPLMVIQFVYRFIPPETSILCPFTHLASSEHKKATTLPMSSAFPTRPKAVCEAINASVCGLFLISAPLKSVLVAPGATTFARMPRAPYSLATYLANTSIAPLQEAYTE